RAHAHQDAAARIVNWDGETEPIGAARAHRDVGYAHHVRHDPGRDAVDVAAVFEVAARLVDHARLDLLEFDGGHHGELAHELGAGKGRVQHLDVKRVHHVV